MKNAQCPKQRVSLLAKTVNFILESAPRIRRAALIFYLRLCEIFLLCVALPFAVAVRVVFTGIFLIVLYAFLRAFLL